MLIEKLVLKGGPMSANRQRVADLLFGGQIVLGFVMVGTRIIRMMETVQGVALCEFILIIVFALINLWLATGANRASPSRLGRQLVFTYAFWSVLVSGSIITALANGYTWKGSDTSAIGAAVLLGIIGVFIARVVWGHGLTDPMVRGYFALVFKAWPQIVLAWVIATEGNRGLPLTALVVGHVTILIRITQIWMSIRESGMDRNRRAALMSELGNELSWVAVTISWAIA